METETFVEGREGHEGPFLQLKYTPVYLRRSGDFTDYFDLITQDEREDYRKRRFAKACTVGSEWVFFRNDDPKLRDPWAARDIRIIGVRKFVKGLRFLAICTTRDFEKAKLARVPLARWVKYSELW